MGFRDWMHGVGVEVSGLSLDESLKKAGLDWTVETSYFQYGDDMQYLERGRKVAYRSDNGAFIDLYATRQPWQNDEIVGSFREFCESAEIEMTHLGSLDNGKVILAGAKIPHQTDLKKVGDVSEYYLLLKDGHTRGLGLQVSLYSNRLICTNGANIVVRDKSGVIPHTSDYESNKEKVKELIDSVFNTIKKKEQVAEKLTEVTMTREVATLHLIKAFGDPTVSVDEQPEVVKTCLRLFDGEAKGSELMTAFNTSWGLLQAVSEYFNWHSPSRSNQNVFKSIIQGTRGQQINQFEKQLVSVHLG